MPTWEYKRGNLVIFGYTPSLQGEEKMPDKSLDKVLISLAFMKVNWDQRRRDYIDNFLPFLATLMVRKKYESIEENAEQINKLANDFEQEFGLIIPYHPMITILNRARKRRLIKKQEHKFVPTEKIFEYDFSGKTQVQERKHEELIKSFINFCKDEYNQRLNREEAEKILIGFLKQHDLEILFAAYDKSALPEIKLSKSNIFLFNKFVESIHTQQQKLFRVLLDIVIGHILASIVLYGHEFAKFSKPRLKDLSLYLDTRLVLRLLGIERREIQFAYSKFLAELKTQGVNLFVFQHTYEEIMGILQSCLRWIENTDYDSSKASPALRYFRGESRKRSDVQIFINRLDKTLDEYSIERIDTPDPNVNRRYQIDEERLQQIIIEMYETHNPDFTILEGKDYTIQRDIQSIAAVYKLRKATRPQNIKQAEHIFITTNSALAYASMNFGKEEYGQGFYIPACVTDIFIGTLVWLKDPHKVVEINERRIIAEIYAALQPSEALLKRYLAEVEKLRNDKRITEDDYILLRDSQVARELLAEETLGDPDRYMPKTPVEILNRIRKEAYDKYIREKKEHGKTKNMLESEREGKTIFFDELDKKADKTATYGAYAVLVIFSLLSLLSYLKLEGKTKWIVSSILLFFGICALCGINIKIIKRGIKKIILRFLGVKW